MRKRVTGIALSVIAVLAAGLIATAAHGTSAAADMGKPQLKHIFVIMLENHSQSSVIGDPNLPYISSLASRYAVADNYYGVTHPSEPNYVAAISGSNWFVNNDSAQNRFDHTNLIDQLEATHHTWGAYMEAMPSDNKLTDFWPSSSAALYASKHNPFVLFTDIRSSQDRLAHVKPYTALATDLRKEATTPDFVWISPDQCNDMHGGVYAAIAGHPETPCPYGSTNNDANDVALKQKADAFVQRTVTEIMHSPAWKSAPSAIFIVSDEGDYTSNATNGGWGSVAGCCDSPIVAAGDTQVGSAWPGGMYGGGLVPAIIVTNRGGKTGGYVSHEAYNHYSLLATVEQAWRLGYLGNASDTTQVKPMDEFLPR